MGLTDSSTGRAATSRRASVLATLCLAVAAAAPSRGEEPPAASAPAAPAVSEADAEIAVAQRARPGVVRIRWQSPPPERATVERNAIVVESDGTLVMAGPVPDAAGTLLATLADGRNVSAQVVASDEASAIVLLRAKLPADDLTALPLAPTPPNVKDPFPAGSRIVMITGTGAIARGAIRAHDRHALVRRAPGEPAVELTCLDEAALPVVAEDLGSPWLDAQGRVVGLLVSGGPVPETQSDMPIRIDPVAAYGLPASVVNVVWPLLRDHHVVDRARLGVQAGPPSDAMEAQVCPSCGGVVVQALEPGGPAETAGLLRYDVIAGVNGRPLRREEMLHDSLLPFRPGERVKLTLLRKGERIEKTVLLGLLRRED